MGRCVEASENPIDVDQADEERCAAAFPAPLVDESCEDEFGDVVLGYLGRNGDEMVRKDTSDL